MSLWQPSPDPLDGNEDEPEQVSAEWRKITCEEREAIVRERGYYYGEYGLPKVFTEWGTYEGEPVLRDVRHPAEDLEHNPSAPDRLPCEHYVINGSKP